MAISFSGLASGMDTSSWVEALVSVKQSEITKLETNKSTIAAAQQTLNSVKSYFSSFQSLLENVTDARFGIASTDLFSQNLAESSNVSVLSAIATTSAENSTYNIEVNKLATATEVNSGIENIYTTVHNETATNDTKLVSLFSEGDEITAGTIEFYVDNNVRSIEIDENTTISDFIDSLNTIGISASYNASSGIFSINMSTSIADASTRIKSDSTNVMAALNLQDVNTGYKTDVINIYKTVTVEGTATIASRLEDIGVTDEADCKFEIKRSDNSTVIVSTFRPDSTLVELFNVLKNDFDIDYNVDDDGVITLTSDIGGNIFSGALADALGFSVTEEPYISLSKMTSTDIVNYTKETLVNRDSTLGQIGAYENAGDTLIIRKCDGGETVTTITSLTESSTVQDLFNVLSAYGITASINDGVISLNSTTGNYVDGNIATKIGIQHPVTDTYYVTAPSVMTSTVGIDTSSSLGGLGMSSDGSVVIYSPVYGIVSVNISRELTVEGFCNKINDSNYGIKAEIVGNKVQLSELSGSGAYVKGMSSVIQSALKLSVGEGNSYVSNAVNIYTNTDSTYLKYDDDENVINSDTVISSIVGYRHGTGEMLLSVDGVKSTITIDSTLTLGELINNPIVGLAQYDIQGNILSDGKAYLTSDGDIYLEQIAGGSELLTALKFTSLAQTTVGQNATSSTRLMSTVVNVGSAPAATTDLLNKLNRTYEDEHGSTVALHTEGSLIFKVNDYYKTVNLESKDTFGTLLDKLKAVGIDAYLTRGSLYIASGYDNVEYISGESTSHLAQLINLSGPTNLGGYAASSAPVKEVIATTVNEKYSAANFADRNTLLSTVGVTKGELTVYRNGQRANITIVDGETFSSLQSKLNTQFSDIFIDFDDDGFLRNGNLKIYSRDGANVSIGSTSDKTNFVAVTGLASSDASTLESSRQLYKVNDRTSLNDSNLFRDYAGKTTLLKDMGITAGNLTVKDGLESVTINIEENDTFLDLQTKLNNVFDDLHIDFDEYDDLRNGCLNVYSSEGKAVSFLDAGTAQDSNFNQIAQMNTQEDNSAMSKRLYQKVRTGYFKVGGAEIYITANDGGITTNIADIVSQINSSEKSLATAYWDNINGKLVIKSTVTGASAVNIEAGTTNFTELLGLTKDTNMVMENQTIGSNAVVTINGAKYTSLSNNVTSDSTGLTGLTLNLKGLSSGSVVQLSVKRDTATLISAINNILDGYNELMSNIDAAIAKGGNLSDQSMLRLIRNNIRTAMNSSDAGTTRFRNLSAVGIKASGSNASNISTANSDIINLSLDEETFLNAYENYGDDVKALLIGSVDSKGNIINKGILVKVEELIENALTAAGGYFTTANNAYSKELDKVSEKIVNGTAAIEKYRKRLEKKFSSMDIMIAEMQNQFSSFLTG